MAKHVFVFIPAFGHTILAPTVLATVNLAQHFAAKSINMSLSTLSFPDIAELRSMATTIWYDTMPHSDYFLFIDADMGFNPEMVIDMVLFDEPLIGTIYPQRRMPLSWAGSGTGESVTERRGNFMVVEGVGMGCTLIRRDCMKTVVDKYPELSDTRLSLHPAAGILQNAGCRRMIRSFEKLEIPERGIVSEDLSFCIRYNRAGGKVWAAIGYQISHVGMYDYSGCYLQTVLQQQAQLEAQQVQAAMHTNMVVHGTPFPGRPSQTETNIVTLPMPSPLDNAQPIAAAE